MNIVSSNQSDLYNLPVEIKVGILSNCELKDLCRMAQVSKIFSVIIEEIGGFSEINTQKNRAQMVEIIHASYKSWSYPSFMTLSQSVNFERDLPESEEDKTLNSASLNDLRKIATDFSNQLRKAFDNLHLSQSNRNNTPRNFRKK